MAIPTKTEKKVPSLSFNYCDSQETLDSLASNNMINEDEPYFVPNPIPATTNNVALLGEDGRILDSKKQLTPDGIGAVSKVIPTSANNVALLDETGKLKDSKKAFTPDGIGATSKKVPSTAGNAAGLDASGNLIDLGDGSGDAWKFTPAFGGSNKAATDMLLIHTNASTSLVNNQNSFVGTEDATTLTNSPVTSGAFYAYRTVYPLKTDVGTKVCVELRELYPSLGRVWVNLYQSNTTSWSGWVENAGCAPKAPLMSLNTTTKATTTLYTEPGVYWINPNATTDVPNSSWGFLRVFVGGNNILQEFYAALNSTYAFRVYVNGGWQNWHGHFPDGGGNGVWRWKINHDNSVDLWCSLSLSGISTNQSLGSLYRSTGLSRPNYPFTVNNACVQATWNSNGFGGFLWSYSAGGETAPPGYYLVRTDNKSGISGKLDLYVHGTYGG